MSITGSGVPIETLLFVREAGSLCTVLHGIGVPASGRARGRPTMVSFVLAVRRTMRLLGEGQRWKWAALVATAMIAAGFEACGAFLIYALLGLISSASPQLVVPLLGDVTAQLRDVPLRTLQVGAGVLVATFFVVRTVVMLGQHYLQARLVRNAGARLSTHLLKGYLALPYITHTQINSAELVRNAFDSVQTLETEVIKPAVDVMVELIMVISLTLLLLFVSTSATLIALVVLGPAVVLLQAFVQPVIKRLGRTSQNSRRCTLQAMRQALSGIRDIRLLGREAEFENVFNAHRRVMARAAYMKTALSEVPRTVTESLVVLVIVGVTVLAVMGGGRLEGLAATLGVFAYAGLRLQPSLRKIVQGLNHIRFGTAVIDDLLADRTRGDAALAAQRLSHADTDQREFRDSIVLRDVSFAYAANAPAALQRVDLTIRKGEFIGICGPTGGGKSTLIDLIVGLLQPTAGAVLVDGRPLESCPAWWFSRLGVVSQNVYLLDDTIRRNIAFGSLDAEIDEVLLDECLERAQLRQVIAELPRGLDTVVGERGVRLSGGQRQRVAVARALYRQPPVIVFDEGTAALDTRTEAALVEALDRLKEGCTLISVAHRISTVRHADRIIVVQGGRIASQGTYAELLEKSELFRALAS